MSFHSTQSLAARLTPVEVDPDDPVFDNPTKPIELVCTDVEANAFTKKHGWTNGQDGELRPGVRPHPAGSSGLPSTRRGSLSFPLVSWGPRLKLHVISSSSEVARQ